ncbi:sigma-B regulation protein RsbU (phosphoserine phosphatase) [Hypnocyclicus thermotrophus]|uniref:Anti-sigma factor antagonist n=1 Tax=Hypnocyclicus thermotrophus TaxID=1627895 RepID=A0AA46DX51_9FUSO|nr:anti-sigma factor antagonist [Hypnocyclicus thermotrophus]TDT67859.1 sigma-B regulation protein RsbU (phosphoserine phosphatase) [Hypnocyclicus thermotrophus]
MKKRIAIIIKDHELERNISDLLRDNRYIVDILSVENIIDNILENKIDLLILGAQSINEIELARKSEKVSQIPVIVVFDRNVGNADIVDTFKKGVSDIIYVKKESYKPILDAVDRFFNKDEEEVNIEIKNINQWTVITIKSELNPKNSYYLKVKIDELLKNNRKNFIIDISTLNYMESVGLGVLIYIRKKVHEISGEAKYIITSNRIKKLISIVKLEKYIEMYDNINDVTSIEVDNDKILVAIVDDAKFMRALISTVLQEEGFATIAYGDPLEALEELRYKEPDIILVDYEMPNLNGLEFIREFKPKKRNIPTVMLTTETDVNLAVSAMRLGASDFLNKPFKKEELIHILKKVVKENKLMKENERLFQELQIREKELKKKNNQLFKLYSELEEELKLASEIQKKLLPQSYPDIAGYNFAVKYKPSQDIGGDFYDFINLNNNSYGIAFADVSGHGIPAALLSTIFKVHLVTHSKEIQEPSKLLTVLNEKVVETFPDGKFISLFYLLMSQESDTIRYCRASQEPVLHLKKDGSVQELPGSSQVLGLFSEKDFPGVLNFEDKEVELLPGEKLFFYTDGINEAQNKNDEFYGLDRLKQVLSENINCGATELIENIYGDLKDFLEGLPVIDDLTLMCIEKK